MAQISESLVQNVLKGYGITAGEIDQLCHFYLNNLDLHSRLTALEAECAQMREAARWRPIETAPNYVDILVAYNNGCAQLIQEDDNDYVWKPYLGVTVGIVSPTHWMPLPSPPAQSAPAQGEEA